MDLVYHFVKNIIYPLMEKKNGNKIRINLSELVNNETLSRNDLLEKQKSKLKKLLLFSVENVPQYKKMNYLKDLIDKNPYKALSEFPILTKKFFNENFSSFIAEKINNENLILNYTGGSTGRPTKFFMDKQTVEYYEAARWRGMSWWGITPYSRSVMIWGNTADINSKNQKIHDLKERFLKNRIIIPAHLLDFTKIVTYVKIINQYKPDYIYGYSGAIYTFAKLMKNNNLCFNFKPKVTVVTSETIFDYQKELISKVFNSDVASEYGARDAGILAFECKNHYMHLTVDNAIIEVLDFKDNSSILEKPGNVVVTDLNNFSQPRIRYKLGDVGILTNDICKCGISLPILKSIEGREDAIVVTKNGKYIHGTAISGMMKYYSCVEKYQFIQKSFDFAEFYIVFNNYKKEKFGEISEKIKNILPDVNIAIKIVDDIPVTKSGKFRYVIREFEI